MNKVWEYIKTGAMAVAKAVKSTYAAEWTVVVLGVLNILADKRTAGLVIAGLGVFYLINAIAAKGE